MGDLSIVQTIAVWILPVVFAITIHEVAHGWVAKKQGDKTAFLLGRLTLNPLKHIDLVGTIIIPVLLLVSSSGFIFGWAKPVPVDMRNFKNPKKSMALVAVAGPVSNLLMAVFWALIIRLGVVINAEEVSLPLIYTGIAGISINLVLAIINLIPVPPLDGSRIVSALLPDQWAYQYNRLERYGFIILLALLWTDTLSVMIAYPMSVAKQFFFSLAGML